MLEALLKRVDGLEKRLQDDSHPLSPESSSSPVRAVEPSSTNFAAAPPPRGFAPPTLQSQSQSQPPSQNQSRLPDAMLDAYFGRLHGKPYYILDEASTRQRHQLGHLPAALSMAIYALTSK